MKTFVYQIKNVSLDKFKVRLENWPTFPFHKRFSYAHLLWRIINFNQFFQPVYQIQWNIQQAIVSLYVFGR